MPTEFKNVSEITQQIMKIVQDNSDLRDVWIQGRISEDRPTQKGDINFTITDKNEEIQCVIFNDRKSLQENLPEAGNNVSVKGQIYVNAKRSEYRFMVTDIKLPKDPLPTQFVSVSTLINTFKTAMIEVHSGEVQGEISDFFPTRANYTILKLKDTVTNGESDDVIECVLPPEIDSPFPLKKGEKVQVIGKFGTFSKTGAYRIEIDDANNITEIDRPTQEQTTPNECQRCGQPCEPQYQLCPTDHYAELDHEGIVVGAVLRYFTAPKFTNFSTKREYLIKWGANKEGRADVALLNSAENPVAIAECKHIGYDGNDGIVQLEGYIAPTIAKLGLFANNTDPYEWTFLKRNDERNRYDEITRSQFERELGVDAVPGLPPNQTRLELIHGNIIEAEVDAIVTTANPLLTKGSGVDEAIWDAGGKEIESEAQEIINHKGFRPEGEVVITTGGKLSVGHIIHAVGPIYVGKGSPKADVLTSCYKSSLCLAAENGIRSIAFPAISTGKNFRYPIEQATPIALKAVKEFVEHAHQNNDMVPERIQFVLFDEEDYNCYVKEFSKLGFGLSCLIG